MFERFTDRARRVVVLAQEEARLLNHNYIGTEHILLGLIHEGEGVAAKALESLGISLEAVRSQVEEIIGQGGSSPSGHIPFTPRAKKVLELSLREALQLGHNYIGTEHILLGLIREGEGVAAQVLVKLGADLSRVRQQVIQLLSGYSGPGGQAAGGEKAGATAGGSRRAGPVGLARARPVRPQPHPAGPREEARPGHRPRPRDRAGHAGAQPPHQEQPGAHRRARRRQDRHRRGPGPGDRRRRRARDPARTSSSTPSTSAPWWPAPATAATSRSASRRCSRRSRPAATSSCSSTSSTPSWAPARPRAPSTPPASSSRCWPAASCRPSAPPPSTSTASTSRRTPPSSAASSRSRSRSPSVAHTIEILKGLRDRYEAHHRVTITDQALVAAANLADRYISDRHLPDKAIDLIDEAGSPPAHQAHGDPAGLQGAREPDRRGRPGRRRRPSRPSTSRRPAACATRRRSSSPRRRPRRPRSRTPGVDLFDEVDEEAIAEVLSIWTGIPVYKLTEEETAKLLRMEDELHKRVIGQEERHQGGQPGHPPHPGRPQGPQAPQRARSSSWAPRASARPSWPRPSPSSSSATSSALISLDMSEYMEKHTVSRLVGSPPGYVGYEEGGQLTEAVRRKPFSVVLFDEIEKAHPDVFNTLLQILEEGRLTDSQGRSVDFRNTVLIMTSNLGTAGPAQGQRRLRQGRRGGHLREDEGEGQRRAEAALPARVPEPHRRHHRLPRAVQGRGHHRSST